MNIRSPFFYVGDKRKLVNSIKRFFPPDIRNFVEPFVGGGSVFMNVSARRYILNDIDRNVIELHKMLCSFAARRDDFFEKVESTVNQYGLSYSLLNYEIPIDLKKKYPKTYFAEYNRVCYDNLKSEYNKSENKDPFILYLLLIYGFNRMIRFNGSGKFNVPVGNVDFNKNVFEALSNYFDIIEKRDILWHNLDFRKFFQKVKFGKKDFVYLDPPYLITFSEYNKIWKEQSEIDLLNILDSLNRRNIKFAVSNVTHYKNRVNEIFLDWSKNYFVHSVKSNYISYHDNTIKKFNEVLVTNY